MRTVVSFPAGWPGLIGMALVCALMGCGPARTESPVTPNTASAEPFAVAAAALEAGRIPDAVAALQGLLAVEPSNGDALTVLGNIAMLTGDGAAAVSFHQQAIDADPRRADYFNNLALVRLRRGQLDEAYANLLTAVRLEPDHVDALYNLGNLLIGGGDPAPAAEYYRRVLAIDPGHAGAHYKMGALHKAAGETRDAIREYEEAVRLDPALIDARADLGVSLLEQGAFREAAYHLQQVVEQAPDRASAHYALGLALQQWGMTRDAIARLETAVALEPGNADYRLDLGLAELDRGDAGAAQACEQQLLEALAARPDYARANYLAGVFYDDVGQPLLAGAYLERAVQLGYHQPPARLFLARNYLRAGQAEKARPLLKDLAATLPPEDEIREQALLLLRTI
jgi:tetratricopeptide (TPR) repeat protein